MSNLREGQTEAFAELRNAVEIHVQRILFVDLSELVQVAPGGGDFTEIILESRR
jgi:hypothetical protein